MLLSLVMLTEPEIGYAIVGALLGIVIALSCQSTTHTRYALQDYMCLTGMHVLFGAVCGVVCLNSILALSTAIPTVFLILLFQTVYQR